MMPRAPCRLAPAYPGVVGDEVEGDHRLPVRLADQVEDARQRQVVHIVRRIVPVRAVLTEARERAVDESRVDPAQGVIVRAEALHYARAEALHEDVGRGGELAKDRLPLRRLHVQRHGALVAVDEGVDRPADPLVARRAAGLGCLDLEDLGSHVGQHHRGKLRRRHSRQLENPDPVECAH